MVARVILVVVNQLAFDKFVPRYECLQDVPADIGAFIPPEVISQTILSRKKRTIPSIPIRMQSLR